MNYYCGITMFIVFILCLFSYGSFCMDLKQSLVEKDEFSDVSKHVEKVNGIVDELQGMCLASTDRTGKDMLMRNEAILEHLQVYKSMIESNKQIRSEVKWLIEESKGWIGEDKIVDGFKRDIYGESCSPVDCSDWFKYWKKSDIYTIYPTKSMSTKVYCEMTTDGGVWTVIQRHVNDKLDFRKNWVDYKNGFGDLMENFWLGNENIHLLTHGGEYELRIELTYKQSNETTFANYKTFVIASEADQYKLLIGNYSGNAGDSMAYSNGMKFSTDDRDNDEHGGKCTDWVGPWWHKKCCHAALNNNGKLEWNDKQQDLQSEMKIRRILK